MTYQDEIDQLELGQFVWAELTYSQPDQTITALLQATGKFSWGLAARSFGVDESLGDMMAKMLG